MVTQEVNQSQTEIAEAGPIHMEHARGSGWTVSAVVVRALTEFLARDRMRSRAG